MKKNQIDLENILLSYLDVNVINIEEKVADFYGSLDIIYENLRQDATKIYEGDPAATSVHEVIVSYPGFYAIAVYRIANKLTRLQIPILPRVLSEYAHGKTGVDIHPNATIGVPFMIDHGTGIVIGATSIIGKNVSIYQGVTLGASQVSKDLSEIKRHPTVEDNVIIYARSTILGGYTVIGHDSIIGGSVFLTKTVSPYSSVFNTHQLRIDTRHQPDIVGSLTLFFVYANEKTKYAIKALMILAKGRSDLPLRAADIAARERIPAKYLESVLVELRNAGFLHSKKGMSGGYTLGKPADAILLVQILRLTDGPIALVPCASLNYYHKCEECHVESSCGIRAVYIGIRDATLKILSETSIADLINKEKNLELIFKKV